MTIGRIPEFYPERQGRPVLIPISDKAIDIDKGIVAGISTAYIKYVQGEFTVLEETIKQLSNEQIILLQKLLTEIIQSRLHLASLSDADVDEKSAREN